MTILNIIDERNRPYRFKRLNAKVEPAGTIGCNAADQAGERRSDLIIEERWNISLNEAIAWAATFLDELTLYLSNAR
jgi:hypothetical protein